MKIKKGSLSLSPTPTLSFALRVVYKNDVSCVIALPSLLLATAATFATPPPTPRRDCLVDK